MIIQYLSRVKNEEGKEERIERIVGDVTSVTIEEKDVIVTCYTNGSYTSTSFAKDHSQIYQMWLLNDQFKTLKKLI